MVLAPEPQLQHRPSSSQRCHDGLKANDAKDKERQAEACLQNVSAHACVCLNRACCVGITATEMIMTIFSSSLVQFMRRIRSSIVDTTIANAAILRRRDGGFGGRCCGGFISF